MNPKQQYLTKVARMYPDFPVWFDRIFWGSTYSNFQVLVIGDWLKEAGILGFLSHIKFIFDTEQVCSKLQD